MIIKRNIWILFILMSALVLNGCGAIAAAVINPNTDEMLDYNVTATNQSVLQTYAGKRYSMNIGKFTDASEHNKTVKCRLMTSVTPPKDETYAKYIEHAFQKEFTKARLYNPRSPIIINTTIHKIDGGSVYGNAYWAFDITLTSSNGVSYRFKSRYEYESSMSAAYACSDMYKTFPLALQKLIHDGITDPKFVRLLQK